MCHVFLTIANPEQEAVLWLTWWRGDLQSVSGKSRREEGDKEKKERRRI
jgi:hypothetical protein